MTGEGNALRPEQVEAFKRDGYIVVEEAISRAQLAAARAQMDAWVALSRAHQAPFGEPTVDGKPRFDLAPEHCAETPALRRVNNPSDLSQAFEHIMRESRVADMVADLLGGTAKFHHCKINLKLPRTATEVAFHQDFGFTPHTNDDVVTALIMLDHMTEENGCLSVVPGSHKGPMHSLFDGEVFTGFVAEEVAAQAARAAVPVVGAAGGACLMHTCTLHGSKANASAAARGLYIAVYSAADAYPIAPNPMPNPNEGQMIRGQASRLARLEPLAVEIPQQPKRASFFAVQEEAGGG